MNDTIETVGQLLGAGEEPLSDVQINMLVDSKEMTALKGALAVVPSRFLTDLPHAIGDVLKSAFGIQVGDVLATGWNTGGDLLKYHNKAEYPPDAVFEHPLGEHTVTSTFHPMVEVRVNDAPVPGANIEFAITLSLIIESAVLRIRNAHLIGATLAKCHGKATLKCGQAVLMERPSRDFTLPTIRFKAPIAIS